MPLPVAPTVMVSHASLLAAVQAQPVDVVTAIVPDPPADATFADAGEIASAHVMPACVRVNVLPPAVSVPVRGVVAVFGATLYVTEPLPLPVAPALIVIHASLLVAVHAQPVDVATATVPVPPPDVTLADAGEIVGVQIIAACVIANVLPPTVTAPVRDVATVFAATL